MVEFIGVNEGLIPAFLVGFAEEVIGDNSGLEAGVAGERVSSFDVLFAFFLFQGVVCPFCVGVSP